MMMPVYTLPGCMETEVTLDEWRRQQREDRREPVKESVRESFGAPLVSEDGDSVRKNPLAAWESTSEVDDRVQGSIAMADKIANEWWLPQTAAAVRIQAVWRGFICRRWVETLRQNYHRAATVIQVSQSIFSIKV